jgi:hypothetical protein
VPDLGVIAGVSSSSAAAYNTAVSGSSSAPPMLVHEPPATRDNYDGSISVLRATPDRPSAGLHGDSFGADYAIAAIATDRI